MWNGLNVFDGENTLLSHSAIGSSYYASQRPPTGIRTTSATRTSRRTPYNLCYVSEFDFILMWYSNVNKHFEGIVKDSAIFGRFPCPRQFHLSKLAIYSAIGKKEQKSNEGNSVTQVRFSRSSESKHHVSDLQCSGAKSLRRCLLTNSAPLQETPENLRTLRKEAR